MRCRSIMLTAQFLILAALIERPALSNAVADTVIPITGIGTSISGDSPIHTHVDCVRFSAPTYVVIQGMPVCEIRGTISGIGWGGTGILARAVNEHYHYDMPFVARWRKDCRADRLVFYNHGGGTALITAVIREKDVGAANSNRTAELNGDLLVGVGALLDQAAYISINRRGLRNDGTFSATYLSAVSPLTASEATDLKSALGGFQQPGLTPGAPVPLIPTNDAATFRDVARALEQIVAGLAQRSFRTRIAVGTSSGARLLAALNFGRSAIGTKSVRTGGNHVIPYDIGSPRIFDGFILNGFPYVPGVEQADSAFPLSAPTMFYQGQGDERYQQHVTMAHELLQKGVVLDGRVWLYEVKNLTHVTRDNLAESTPPSNGDRLGCFLSAGIRNLRALIEAGASPPRSRMAGRIIGGELRFDQAGGSTANDVPIPNDPTLDVVVPDPPQLVVRHIGSAETTRWLAVTAALPHEHDAIAPPTVACRLGGYKLKFFMSQLVPLPPAALSAKYGGFQGYRQCVCQCVNALAAQCLYDARVESADETAEFARKLFD